MVNTLGGPVNRVYERKELPMLVRNFTSGLITLCHEDGHLRLELCRDLLLLRNRFPRCQMSLLKLSTTDFEGVHIPKVHIVVGIYYLRGRSTGSKVGLEGVREPI